MSGHSYQSNADTGAALRELRRLAGLTARDAARLAGTTRRRLRKVESGEWPASPSFYGAVAAACAEHIRAHAIAVHSAAVRRLALEGRV